MFSYSTVQGAMSHRPMTNTSSLKIAAGYYAIDQKFYNIFCIWI